MSHVSCARCRETVPSARALEVVVLLTARRGGSLGGVEHLTPVNTWYCRPCARSSPFGHQVLLRLAEELHRPAATVQRGLALGGAS